MAAKVQTFNNEVLKDLKRRPISNSPDSCPTCGLKLTCNKKDVRDRILQLHKKEKIVKGSKTTACAQAVQLKRDIQRDLLPKISPEARTVVVQLVSERFARYEEIAQEN